MTTLADSVVRELKSVEAYADYYDHMTFCGNCGEKNYCYVRKGTPLTGQSITCDKCGCRIRLRSGS